LLCEDSPTGNTNVKQRANGSSGNIRHLSTGESEYFCQLITETENTVKMKKTKEQCERKVPEKEEEASDCNFLLPSAVYCSFETQMIMIVEH
jgi:hypothetical protein